MQKLFKRVRDKASAIDQFGHPVVLKFRSEETYNTVLGGLVTVLSVCLVLFYFGFQVAYLFNKQKDKVETSTFWKNRIADEDEYLLDRSFFMFGIKLTEWDGTKVDIPEDIGEHSITYVYTEDTSLDYVNFAYDKLPLISCEGLFDPLGPDVVDKMNLNTLYCLEQDSVILKGNFYNADYRHLEVRIKGCDNATSPVTCKSQTEIDEYFGDKYFEIFAMQRVPFYEDYGNPWRMQLDESNYW